MEKIRHDHFYGNQPTRHDISFLLDEIDRLQKQLDDGPIACIPAGQPAHDNLDGCHPPLRDYFAGLALAGTLSQDMWREGQLPALAAHAAYTYADAMLVEREKAKPGPKGPKECPSCQNPMHWLDDEGVWFCRNCRVDMDLERWVFRGHWPSGTFFEWKRIPVDKPEKSQ